MMNPTTLNLNESLLNLQILDFNLDTEVHYSAGNGANLLI